MSDRIKPKDINVLLTGSTGFLGSNVLEWLIKDGFHVVVLLRESSDTLRIAHLLNKVRVYYIERINLKDIFLDKIDVIIHCATNYGRQKVEPSDMLEANLILPLKLLQLGKYYGVTCFINTDTVLDKRVSSYSLSKTQFKEWLKLYATHMRCVNISLEHFYGANDNESKFVTFIVRSLIQRVNEIPLTKGEQKRDFIYIQDVISAFKKIFGKCYFQANGFYHYEVGTGKTISICDFVLLVKKLTGNYKTVLKFGALPYRRHEIMESKVDITRLRSLNWKPTVSLKEGLHKMINLEKVT